MKKKNRKNNKAGIITVGGNFTLPGLGDAGDLCYGEKE